MNHDYAHCSDFTEKCPKSCFRAQLSRDLKNNPLLERFVSFMSFKDAGECEMEIKPIDFDVVKEIYMSD